MNPSRTNFARQIDWAAVKGDASAQCQQQILLRLRSLNQPQSLGEIRQWFRGTRGPFIDINLNHLIVEGKVLTIRSGRGLERYTWRERSHGEVTC